MIGWLKKRRREKVKARPFPPGWARILERNVPYVRCLTEENREELHGLIQVFLEEKNFEGAGGLEMTDEIRVTIAAQACVLLLRRQTDVYPKLSSIIVYPSAYVGTHRRALPGGAVEEGAQVRLGESWTSGAVVLSWNDVLRGASDIADGRNVAFHEFAHQLDGETGPTDGAPRLGRGSMYVAWARVLGREYERLVARLQRHQPTFLDPYAATNPAEFFAVATEFFFEKPLGLRDRCPELYDQLKEFYRQDPAAGIVRGERPC
ncbi:MAG: M90 family metallopeptidase [Candidatus Eisenbacteria bacterium]